MSRFGLSRVTAALAAGMLAACSSDNTAPVKAYSFDFAEGAQQFNGGFADYPDGEEAAYELVADYRALPAEIDAARSALFISGNNHSDDLFMYYTRHVDGLQPNRTYTVRFEVEIATEAQRDCVGVGGAPGESVYLKAGASTAEPRALVDDTGYRRMNIDKGDQSVGGSDALVLGDIANTQSCGAPQRFERKTLDSDADSLAVTADSDGAVWLLMGTDSGFEATTRLYYTRFVASFSE